MKQGILLIIIILGSSNIMFAQNNSITAGVYDTTMTFVDINPDTIIYHDYYEDYTHYTLYKLDLNQDGILDCKFRVVELSSPGGGDEYVELYTYNDNEVAYGRVDISYDNESNKVYTRVVRPFEYGELIDSTSAFYPWGTVFQKIQWTDVGGTTIYIEDWANIGPKYMGIRMNIDDTLVYAWVKLEITDLGYDELELIVYEYALSKNFNLNAGVEDELEYNIKYYPNPFDDYLNIQVPDNTNISQIRIIDLFGRKQNSEINIKSKHITINTTNLNKGMYILSLTVNGKVYSSKILKE